MTFFLILSDNENILQSSKSKIPIKISLFPDISILMLHASSYSNLKVFVVRIHAFNNRTVYAMV